LEKTAHRPASLATSDSPQLKRGTPVAPKLRVICGESTSPPTHQQPHISLGKGWWGALSPCWGPRWGGTGTAQPCHAVKQTSQPLVRMRHSQPVLSPRYKHDWL